MLWEFHAVVSSYYRMASPAYQIQNPLLCRQNDSGAKGNILIALLAIARFLVRKGFQSFFLVPSQLIHSINTGSVFNKTLIAVVGTLLLVSSSLLKAQNPISSCDPNVPHYVVDLRGNPDSFWVSPIHSRTGNCCGQTGNNPCTTFKVILDSAVIALEFDIFSGAAPQGALFWRLADSVNNWACGPDTPVGSVICLSGPGTYWIIFCKPGANPNQYSIRSFSNPRTATSLSTRKGCAIPIIANGYIDSTIQWQTIYPGTPGQYNSFLSCIQGCDTTRVNPPSGFVTNEIWVEVSGFALADACKPTAFVRDTIKINLIDPITLSVAPNPAYFCNTGLGSGVMLTATASGGDSATYTFTWLDRNGSVVGTGQTYLATSSGNYTVSVSDQHSNANLCPDTSVVVAVIGYNSPTILGFSPSLCGYEISCFGANDGSINLSISGGVVPYTYAWSNSATTRDISGLAVGTYVVTVTDSNSCTAEATFTLNQPPPLVVSAVPLTYQCGYNISCFGENDGEISLNVNGGCTPYSFLWSDLDTNQNRANLIAGSYDVTVTDANGCTGSTNITLTQPARLTVAITNLTNDSCANTGAGSATVDATGGCAPFSYLWSNAQTTQTAVNLYSGTYTLTITDVNGCTDTISAVIDVEPSTAVQVNTLDTIQCDGDTLLLSASGAASYNWVPVTGLSQPGSAQTLAYPTSTTIYTLIAIDSFGCSVSIPVRVRINPPIDTLISHTQANICPGESIQLFALGHASLYQWEPAATLTDATSSNPIAFPSSTTTYTLTLWDADGCSSTGTTTIHVYPPAFANAGPDTIIVSGTQALLNGLGNGSFLWSPGYSIDSDRTLQSVFVSPLQTNIYTLLVTTSDGCTAADSVQVIVRDETKLWIPNAFSPNGDGVNDVFMIYSSQPIDLDVLLIFNRWGEEVFRTHDPTSGWDGTYQGVPAPIGVYAYIAHVINMHGEPIQRQGNVTLIR